MNDVVKSEDSEKFFHEGQNWEANRVADLENSNRFAWRIAMVATGVAAIACIGIATLAPFKVTIPYLFAVDRATGNVELVSAGDNRAVVGYQDLLDKHWAKKYVTARESYNWKLLQADYDSVLNYSTDEVGREYAAIFQGDNAKDKKFGASVEEKVKVLSVTISHDQVGTKAVVRFEKTTRRNGSEYADAPQYYVATMAFDYKPSMLGKEEVLIDNPIGFKVSAYRRDSEMTQPVTTTVNATTPPSAGTSLSQ